MISRLLLIYTNDGVIMLLRRVMNFSHNLIDFRDDWAVSARSRKVSRMKECGDAATIRGGGSGWPRLARCRAGDRQLVAWAKSRSQRLGGGASNFAGNRFQDSPGARGGMRRISGRFADGCGAGSHHAIPGSLRLPAVGKQAGRAFRFRMSPLPNTSRQVEREEPDRVASAK